MLLRFFFEKVDTRFTQSDGNFYRVLLKRQFLWRWQHVCYHLDFTEWLIGVLDFRVHIFVFLYANSLPR